MPRAFIFSTIALFVFSFSVLFFTHFDGDLNLWIFPLVSGGRGFFLWAFLTLLYVCAGFFPTKTANDIRCMIGMFGLPLFCSLQGVLWLGVLASWLPLLLHLFFQSPFPLRGKKIVWAILCIALLVVGHTAVSPGPSLHSLLSNGRFSLSFLGVFFIYKIFSYGIACLFRGEKSSAFTVVEFFLAPVFWLSPNHATMIPWTAMREKKSEPLSLREKLRALWWIFRATIHAWIFVYLIRFLLPIFNETFSRGLYLREDLVPLFFVGALLLLVSYLEKSRVNYFVAGVLCLAGYDSKPDFQNPFFAKSFLDFWRRYHSWVLDFYTECIYFPLSIVLRKWLSVRRAVIASIFFTFLLGSTLSHYVNYTATFLDALGMSFFTALLVCIHYTVASAYRKIPMNRKMKHLISYLGIPLTWVTVCYLWLVDYAVLGLGWSLHRVWSVMQ